MDLSTIQPLLDWLHSHQEWVAFSIVFIAFLESLALAGVVIPGVLLLFGASAVAGSGVLNIWETLACAFAGAVLGDCLSFFLGKALKDNIRSIWPFRKYPEWISNGESFFDRHGGKSIVIGRFVGPIRPVIPLVAGMLNMPSGKFVSINLISALGWAPTYVIPGFLFGASIHWKLPEGFGLLLIYLGAIALFGFGAVKLSHWHLSPGSRIYQTLHRWADSQHHVRLFWHWLAEPRGQPHAFPLTSLLLFIFSISGLILVAYLVTNTNALGDLNQQVFEFFQMIQHPWFETAFQLITLAGDRTLIRIVALVMVIWLIIKRHFWAALICTITILLTEQITGMLKHSLDIARPLLNEEVLPLFTAFPSSHATRATVLFGLLASFVAQEFHQGRRWWIYGLALIPILLIAVSRLYLNQHWLTDVSGGVFLGLCLCALARLAFSRFNQRPIHADLSFFVALSISLAAAILYLSKHYPS